MIRSESQFYWTGGTMHPQWPSYVVRQADTDLYDGLVRGEFCYVLTSRQMGKSSLMARTAARLREKGTAVVVLDLTAAGQNLVAEQWYEGLLGGIGEQLDLEDELEAYWLEHERMAPLPRWMAAIREVVLAQRSEPIVVFIDEIDTVRSLPFSTDEFFAAIRACYNRRSEDPELHRVTFCLLGVAAPSDLIQDTRTTPFNIGRRIELTDFREAEAGGLIQGLGRDEAKGKALLARVLYWTGGHPALTQRLCQSVAQAPDVTGPVGVDHLCVGLFFSHGARERDDNLLLVRDRLLHSETDVASLLDLYARVCRGQHVRDGDTNRLVALLRLSGAVRVENGRLCVRNRIYARAFDLSWVTTHMPNAELRRQRAAYRRGVLRTAAVAGVVVIAMASLVLWALKREEHARDAEASQRVALARMERARASAYREKEFAQAALRSKQAALQSETAQRQRADESAQAARVAQGRAEAAQREATTEQHQAEQQRQIARTNADTAERERARAVQRLVRLNVDYGVRLLDEEDALGSLPWFVQALDLDHQSGRREEMDRARLGAILRYAPKLIHVWFHEEAVRNTDTQWRWKADAEFSPDGRRVVTASGQSARVWDVRSGRPLTLPMKHQGFLTLARFSPDGRRILTASSDTTARVWNASTGQPITPPLQHHHVVTASFSPDSGRVVTASWDGTARIWDAATGQPITPHLWHSKGVNHAEFSPDGRRVVTASSSWDANQGEARVWDAATGTPITPPLRHQANLDVAQFSPDGRHVLTASWDGTARIWDAGTGQMLVSLPHNAQIYRAAFSPDGRRIVTAGADGAALVWDAITGQQIARLLHHRCSLTDVAFSPDGKQVVTAADDFTARVWDAETGEPLTPPLRHSGRRVVCASFSPDGRRVLTACSDGAARLWETNTSQSSILRHPSGVLRASFSANGRRIATLGDDGTVRVWNARPGGSLTATIPHTAEVTDARLSPNGRLLVIASHDGRAQVYDSSTGRPVTPPMAHSASVSRATFSPDSHKVLTASWDRTARIWDASTGAPLTPPLQHSRRVYDAEFSADGCRVVTGGGDFLSSEGEARVWDAATGRPLGPPLKHSAPVRCARFSPDGCRIVTACASDYPNEGEALIWDVATSRLLTPPMRHQDGVTRAEFSPDGRCVITASDDFTARIWNAATGQPLGPPLQHNKEVIHAAFSPNGDRAITASRDSTARLWDTATGQPLSPLLKHGGPVWDAEFSPDGRFVVTASKDGTARVWDVAPDNRPVESLRLLAELLSGQRIYSTFGLVPLNPSEVLMAWQTLHSERNRRAHVPLQPKPQRRAAAADRSPARPAMPDARLPLEVSSAPSVARGGIGLATWETQAEFRSLQVTQGGRTIYGSNFALGTPDWRPLSGDWGFAGDAYRQTAEGTDRRAVLASPALRDAGDYTIHVQARKLGGAEGFLIMFHVRDEDNYYWWNLGGWGNRAHGIEKSVDNRKIVVGERVVGRIEMERWYDIRIELAGPRIRCHLDGRLIHDVEEGRFRPK